MKHLPVFIRIICARSFSCSCQPIDILVKLFPHGSIFLSPRGLSHLVLMTIMCPFYPMSGATTTIFFTVKFSPPPFFSDFVPDFFVWLNFGLSTETHKPPVRKRANPVCTFGRVRPGVSNTSKPCTVYGTCDNELCQINLKWMNL